MKAKQPVLRGHKSKSVHAVKTKTSMVKKGQNSVAKTPSQHQQCKRCGRDNHPRDNCPASDSICQKCSVKGRWAKVCLSKPKVKEVSFDSDDDGDQWFLRSVQSEVTTETVESKPWITNILIDGVNVKLKVNSGADVTVISDKDFSRFIVVKLVNAKNVLCSPGKSKLEVLGKFRCTMESHTIIMDN